ncbi:MAG: GNAT family N-acetyltransferase, partial [Isosphaeraceae bacterium]
VGLQGNRSSLRGPRFHERLYLWFATDPAGFGLVAVESAKVVGFVAGARLGSGPAITRFTLGETVRALLNRPWLFAHPKIVEGIARKLVQAVRPRPPEITLPGPPGLATASIVGIAVTPGWRGAGVGKSLLREFESVATAKGYRRGYLSVRAKNLAARRSYERSGWLECEPNAGAVITYAKLIDLGLDEAASSEGEAMVGQSL